MTDTTTSSKAKKGPKTLDEEIASIEEKLKRLRAQKAEKEQKELARNQKGIYTFLRAEKLDAIPLETWTKILPQLRRLLKAEPHKEVQADTAGHAKVGVQAPATETERKPGSGQTAVPTSDVRDEVATAA